VGLFLLAFALAVLALVMHHPERVPYALAALAAAAVLAALTPDDLRELASRVTEVGPLKLATRDAQRAAAGAAGGGEDSDEDQDTLLGLRLKLEAKMTYVAKHVVGQVGDEIVSGRANFVTIGSLFEDGLLTREQARTATTVLSASDLAIARRQAPDAATFLDAANEFVRGFRATVFANVVRKTLEADGWSVARLSHDARRDLVASRGEHRIHVIPVFATSEPSPVLERVRSRVEGELAAESEPPYLVIPDGSRTRTAGPRVHSLTGLLTRLGDQRQGRS
jgi:hypothetical protein